MGFCGSSSTFSRFRVLDAVTDEIILSIPDRLKKHAFTDIDNVPETRSYGWVCFDDMLDSQWQAAPPQKGGYLVFSLRLDTRRVPPGVVKKHLALALRAEREKALANNQKFISRERVKELREQVMERLRQRFLPVPAEFNVIWNLENNEIWFASAQDKMIDLFMDFFLDSFELRLERLTPYALAESLLSENEAALLDRLEATSFVN